MTGEADYITLAPNLSQTRFMVVVMKWHARDEQYIQGRFSDPLTHDAALLLAESWARDLHLEIRE